MIENIDNRKETYLNTLLNASRNLKMVSDGKNILSFNKSFLTFLGFKSLEAFLKKHTNISDFFVSEEEDALLPQMGRAELDGVSLRAPK